MDGTTSLSRSGGTDINTMVDVTFNQGSDRGQGQGQGQGENQDKKRQQRGGMGGQEDSDSMSY